MIDKPHGKEEAPQLYTSPTPISDDAATGKDSSKTDKPKIKKDGQGIAGRILRIGEKAAWTATAPIRYPGITLIAAGTALVGYAAYEFHDMISGIFDSTYVQDIANVMQHSNDLSTETREVAELTLDKLLQTLHLPQLDTVNNRLTREYQDIVSQLSVSLDQLAEIPAEVSAYSDQVAENAELLEKARRALDAIVKNETSYISQVRDTLEYCDQVIVDAGQTLQHIGEKTGIHGFIERLSRIGQTLQGQDEDHLQQFVDRITTLTDEKERIQEIKLYADTLRQSLEAHEQNLEQADYARKVFIEAGGLYAELVDLKEQTRSYSPRDFTNKVHAHFAQQLEALKAQTGNEIRDQVATALEDAMQERREYFVDKATLHAKNMASRANKLMYGCAALAELGVVGMGLYVESWASPVRKAGKAAYRVLGGRK